MIWVLGGLAFLALDLALCVLLGKCIAYGMGADQ